MKKEDFNEVYSDRPERALSISASILYAAGMIGALAVFLVNSEAFSIFLDDSYLDYGDTLLIRIIMAIFMVIPLFCTAALLKAVANILRCLKYQSGLYVDEFSDESDTDEDNQ